MSIGLIVSKGFGNGAQVGNIGASVTQGYTIGDAIVLNPETFGVSTTDISQDYGVSSSDISQDYGVSFD